MTVPPLAPLVGAGGGAGADNGTEGNDMERDLYQLAADVAAELGDGWYPEPENYAVGAVCGPDGERITIEPGERRSEQYRGRLYIMGDVSDVRQWVRTPTPWVTLTAEASPVAAARSIRQLIPEYQEALRTGRAGRDEATEQREGLLSELHSMLGGQRGYDGVLPGCGNEFWVNGEGTEVLARLRLDARTAVVLAGFMVHHWNGTELINYHDTARVPWLREVPLSDIEAGHVVWGVTDRKGWHVDREPYVAAGPADGGAVPARNGGRRGYMTGDVLLVEE